MLAHLGAFTHIRTLAPRSLYEVEVEEVEEVEEEEIKTSCRRTLLLC